MDACSDIREQPLPVLLDLCEKGHSKATSELIRRFRGLALDVAGAYTRAEVEDIVQDAFIKALTNLSQLRTPAAFPGWFRQIVRREAMRRSPKVREVPLELAGNAVSQVPGPAESAIRGELAARVRAAVEALPPASRKTAERFYLEEKTCREVARDLRIPEATVRRRLVDLRRRLRSMLLGSMDIAQTRR